MFASCNASILKITKLLILEILVEKTRSPCYNCKLV